MRNAIVQSVVTHTHTLDSRSDEEDRVCFKKIAIAPDSFTARTATKKKIGGYTRQISLWATPKVDNSAQ